MTIWKAIGIQTVYYYCTFASAGTKKDWTEQIVEISRHCQTWHSLEGAFKHIYIEGK